MAIKTIDLDDLSADVGNVYEAVSILSKRARQIASRVKADLDDKLTYFEGFEPELEDPRFQEEQTRISVEYELKPEPTELSIDEMLNAEIYYRDSSEEMEL